jgi:hypothetical protein
LPQWPDAQEAVGGDVSRSKGGGPATLSSTAKAHLLLRVWGNACRRIVDLDPGEQAERHGADLDLLVWCERLVSAQCGSRHVDFVVAPRRTGGLDRDRSTRPMSRRCRPTPPRQAVAGQPPARPLEGAARDRRDPDLGAGDRHADAAGALGAVAGAAGQGGGLLIEGETGKD